jgi:hypothetical protein
VLLVNIHELQVVLAQSVIVAALKNQVEHVRRVFGLEGEDILSPGSAEDLCQGGEVNTQSYVAIAPVWGEALGLEHHRDEGNVGVVHRLERDTGVIAVEVAVLDEILDGINDLPKSVPCTAMQSMQSILSLTFLSRSACSRRASSTIGEVSLGCSKAVRHHRSGN